MDDGSIVIHVDQEPESLRLGVDKLMHEKQYESALRAAVDSSQLVVCNSSGLPQTFTLGRALLDSVIHIDELNRWGTAQQGGQRFSMAVEHPHAGLSPMADGLWFIADAAFALAQQEGMGAEGRVHLCKRMAECAGFPAEHGHHLPTRHLHSKLTRKHTEEHALATGVYPTDVNDWLEAICAPYRWEPNGAVKDRLAAQRALKAEHRKKHEPPPPEKVIRSPLGTVAAIDMIARRELPQKAMTSTTSKGVSQGSKTASPSNDLATDESGGVSDSPSTWQLNKPERYQGYTRPLYELLKAAHLAAHAKPSARDVVEAFRTNQPPEIAKVLADSFDFYDAAGNTKSANVAAVAQAIRRMTTVRPR